jgi:hypothetical protein
MIRKNPKKTPRISPISKGVKKLAGVDARIGYNIPHTSELDRRVLIEKTIATPIAACPMAAMTTRILPIKRPISAPGLIIFLVYL